MVIILNYQNLPPSGTLKHWKNKLKNFNHLMKDLEEPNILVKYDSNVLTRKKHFKRSCLGFVNEYVSIHFDFSPFRSKTKYERLV